jgi:hypothetical protein
MQYEYVQKLVLLGEASEKKDLMLLYYIATPKKYPISYDPESQFGAESA